MHMIDEAIRSIEPDLLFPPDQHPQQVIESDEVVDVRVRDKDVFETPDLSRRQIRYIAEIKHDRTLFKQRLDIERWIAGSPIDKSRMQERSHGNRLQLYKENDVAPRHDFGSRQGSRSWSDGT